MPSPTPAFGSLGKSRSDRTLCHLSVRWTRGWPAPAAPIPPGGGPAPNQTDAAVDVAVVAVTANLELLGPSHGSDRPATPPTSPCACPLHLCVFGNYANLCVFSNYAHLCIFGNYAHLCVLGNCAHLCVLGNFVHLCVLGNYAHLCALAILRIYAYLPLDSCHPFGILHPFVPLSLSPPWDSLPLKLGGSACPWVKWPKLVNLQCKATDVRN